MQQSRYTSSEVALPTPTKFRSKQWSRLPSPNVTVLAVIRECAPRSAAAQPPAAARRKKVIVTLAPARG